MSTDNTQPTPEQQQAAAAQIDAEIAQFQVAQTINALKNELVLTRLKLAGVQAELATMIAANAKRDRKQAKKDAAE